VTEPDVAITDYLLTVEAAVFAVALWRAGDGAADLRLPFVVFFAATALAAFTGGTVHGFFSDAGSTTGVVLWRTTLVALGVVALAAWAIGARMLLAPGAAARLQISAAALAALYAIVVVAIQDRFWIAIAHYLPPTLFMLIAFVVSYRPGRPATLAGSIGLVLTFVAAVVQQRQIAIHPAYFNHNALYHAIQAVGLFLIYWSARELVVSR
jgi:hypothetical protein